MLLQNKIQVVYDKDTNEISFTKLIKTKLWTVKTVCTSCKMFFMVVDGYSRYNDDEFMAEATARA